MYGKIEFSPLILRCLMTPEMQRLREVRLCNINSLCITGSSNTNRFEHAVGTAFLASQNIKYNYVKYSEYKEKQELLIVSALLHDVANGPFGHSYEYIMEKQGFIPEKGLENVFVDVTSAGKGAHGYSSPYEPIYFGKLRGLNSILNSEQKKTVSSIISGKHYFSKLISDTIDLDNIDNVFRMAYHMGIPFPLGAPIELAKAMYLDGDRIVFKKSAERYLNIWFDTRKKVYKFLLLNPQEFSGKYMLTEAMDIVFDGISQKNNLSSDIKWYYTDFELLQTLCMHKEIWLNKRVLLQKGLNKTKIEKILQLNNDEQKEALKSYVESIELLSYVKDKGKSGNSKQIILSNSFKYTISPLGQICIEDRNMKFEISDNKLYKITNIKYNPSQIISRLMTGDLYDCVMIIKTSDITSYDSFLEYSKRIIIENELECYIRNNKDFQRVRLGIHPILDVNKTERQLSVCFENENELTTIGKSSKELLLGIFLKNEPYGLKYAKEPLKRYRKNLKVLIIDFFEKTFNMNVEEVELYKEVDEYGIKRYQE